MKRVLYIVSFLLIAVCGFAETMVTHTCETWRKTMGYPSYYCYCLEESETFQFPLDRIVSDTMWFDANINDLKHGISAYWFADCAVTIEVYAFCSSKTPTISITVGANRMTSKSEEEINKKLAEMGNMAEIVDKILTPHIRVYPHGKGSGHVYCYPENQGPHSTCDSLLPVRRTMKYISSHADDVYVLEPKTMPESGQMYVHWKAPNNHPCTLEVASDCQGGTLFTTTLSDSLDVCWVDSTLLHQKKAAGENLYFRFLHHADTAGWIRFTSDPVYLTSLRDTALCEGKAPWSEQDSLIWTDTIWYAIDTLLQQGYRLSILPPDTLADTLAVPHSQLETGYYYLPADTTLRDTGDYVFTIEAEGECTYILLLNVQETAATSLTSPLHTGKQTRLCLDPCYGIYILRDGKRYNLLGNVIDN